MKIKKKAVILAMFILAAISLTACDDSANFTTSGKSIYVNVPQTEVRLNNVDYYDFLDLVLRTAQTGTFDVVPNSIKGCELYIIDSQGNTHGMVVDVTLSKMPSTFKLYTNSTKTTYDIYTR